MFLLSFFEMLGLSDESRRAFGGCELGGSTLICINNGPKHIEIINCFTAKQKGVG
jgi:hypothetical protein